MLIHIFRAWFFAARFTSIAAAALLFAGGAAGAAEVGDETLHAGTAAADITPPPGFPLSGYYHERGATGTLDPLRAKALYLRQGKREVALVICDVIGVPLALTQAVREKGIAQTGISGAHIIVAGTHTHTGPDYQGFLNADPRGAGGDNDMRREYVAKLTAGIVKAIADAKSAAAPVRLHAGVGQCADVSFNRRFHMKNGEVRFNPGVQNPDIVRAAGPIDPGVGIVLLRGAENGRPAAALTNFAVHLDTVGGTQYSADYPFFLERALQKELGAETLCLFGTGPCGDVNHVDVRGPRAPRGPDGITRTIGEKLAAAVQAELPRLKESPPVLAVRRHAFQAPFQKYTAEDLNWARDLVAQDREGKRLPFLEEVKAYKILRLKRLRERFGDAMPVEVQVVRLGGDVAIVALPGEIFVELGLAIKKASPFATTLVIELANSSEMIYIPTQKAFPEGSYETVNSCLAHDTGKRLADTALRLLNELK